MQLLNENVIVDFDEKHNKTAKIGDLELVIPEMWEFDQLNSGETQYQKQLDLKASNPQIATIVVENSRFDGVKKGDKVFTHYLAYDNSQEIEHEGEVHKTMMIGAIFFKILDNGDLEMMEDVYLGERVYEQGLQTKSGIWLTPFEEKAEKSKVKITHTPFNSPYIEVGDIVYTIDDNQYELDFLGKKYIKLNTWHIVAKA